MTHHDIDPAIYRKAAEKLSTDGWTKEAYRRPGGSSCTAGALQAVTRDPQLVRNNGPVLALLVELIGEEATECCCGCGNLRDAESVVTGWNDRRERTKDDVLTLLEQAAEKLEAEL